MKGVISFCYPHDVTPFLGCDIECVFCAVCAEKLSSHRCGNGGVLYADADERRIMRVFGEQFARHRCPGGDPKVARDKVFREAKEARARLLASLTDESTADERWFAHQWPGIVVDEYPY